MVSAEEGHSLSFSLENLRGMPMRTLLQDKKEIMHNLERALSVCRVLLPDEEIPDADPTYGQVLHLLQRMRGGFGKDPAIDDWDSSRKRKVSESILLVFAELFMPRKADKNADPKATVSISRQSLRQRLLNVSLDTEQLANTPLSGYYQAMSVWTDSSYPNWIYKTQIRPLFEKSGKPESEHTLRLLAAYCQLSYEEKEVNDWKETFPLLYCLLLPESFS